jgi:secondary thiamine-phosphate synthase enzyme
LAWIQQNLVFRPRPRGFHLVTQEVLAHLPEVAKTHIGILHLFLQHTSASLTINENADPDVPLDLDEGLARIAPENAPYRHTCEGPDDMPAHVKNSLLGCAVSLPVGGGKLLLGTWQGIYLCEHRVQGGARRCVATLWGETDPSGH